MNLSTSSVSSVSSVFGGEGYSSVFKTTFLNLINLVGGDL